MITQPLSRRRLVVSERTARITVLRRGPADAVLEGFCKRLDAMGGLMQCRVWKSGLARN
jgi:hypothetical protein